MSYLNEIRHPSVVLCWIIFLLIRSISILITVSLSDSQKPQVIRIYLTFFIVGSYGLAPYIVHKAAQDLSFKLEANPDRFLRLECLDYLNDVRQRLANLVKVDRDEIVLVPNTSVGVNTVLRNFEWEKDDVIICCEFYDLLLL